ncbi:homeobox protein notochord, partial [Diretmus argenteus]
MQVPNRPTGAYGYPVRNYAPVSLYPQYPGSQCASSPKPTGGKSFTIDALLAKPEDADRTSPTRCGVKYQPAAQLLPLTGQMSLPIPPAPFIYSPNMLHSAVHTQPGYSVYCCPPFTFQSSCRAAFYAHESMSKANVHPFKTKGGKSKRMRTSFTNEQLSRLEKEFARQ